MKPAIRRRDTSYTRRDGREVKSHSYFDEQGERVPGVTSILSDGLPKPALIDWAASTTAAYAVDHWDELAEQTPSQRLRTLEGARWGVSKEATMRGSNVHRHGQALASGQDTDVAPELLGYVEAYARFLDHYTPKVHAVESTVYRVDNVARYAGTLDAIMQFPNLAHAYDLSTGTYVVDIKTGKRVYSEVALQLAAYRFATHIVYGDEAHPMPPTDGCLVVYLTHDSYSVVPVQAGDAEFRTFLYVAQVARFRARDDILGKPFGPPLEDAS